ncbi:MAG: hypothetical protein WCI43_09505 [Candidatus Firestonebacteria bacterium]
MNNYSALQAKAVKAMSSAIKKVVKEHKKSGRPLIIWQNGKVVRLSADKLK